jgi:phenylalanyl-tRNA synthetase beta chain
MNASYKWLRDFVDTDLSATEIADLLTSRCATVEGIEATRSDLSEIVIGRVVEAGRHPNSDHLWVTQVDSGTGTLSHVVCGAPNVTVGTLYPFARVGATLPGGLKIEKRKIRGELSEGMLCSARELGLGTDHEGILALETNAEPGARFTDVVPVGDTRLVIDVLPNRPDLLSHIGIAREIAAATGKELHRPFHPPATLTRRNDSPSAAGVAVSVDDTEGAPRYLTATVRGVTVGPSPDWLRERIEAIGSRSISNVVDVTNYMLHGFGQPMHAFDLAKLGGGKVVVRRARRGEKLVTLDGVERTLNENMTVIADARDAQAIAGVIGGKGSEVTSATTDILLEVAAFDPRRVRATRKQLGVSTDASYRFERGVDADALPDLVRYASELITRVAGGAVDGAPTDSGSSAKQKEAIRVRHARVSRVLGVDIPSTEITRHLTSIGFGVEETADAFSVTAPTYRADIEGEIEVIEEIARLHGYDTFPSDIRPFRPGNVPDAPLHTISTRLRSVCVGAGLLEARPMPFVRKGDESHRVRNPLAEDEAYLRTMLLESLSRRVEHNFAHMQRNVRLFEIGTAFTHEREKSGAPAERIHIAAVIAGDRRPSHFTEPRPPHFDEWDAKGLAELIAASAYPGRNIECDVTVGDALWTVTADDTAIGSVQRLSLDAPVWAPPVFGVEIDIEVPELRQGTPAAGAKYVAVPSMPAMEVDLALLVADGIDAESIGAAIRASAGELLESLDVFDEFRGPGIPPGMRSLAWRLTFRHPERTLRDREIQGRTAKILGSLEESFGIKQRTS